MSEAERPEPSTAHWAARLDSLQAEQDRQTARYAEREAELAAFEAGLVARLDARGRLIDRLTAHLGVLTAQHEQDRVALEEALRTAADLEARLDECQRQLSALTGAPAVYREKRPA